MARYFVLAWCLVKMLVCTCACYSGGGSDGGGGSYGGGVSYGGSDSYGGISTWEIPRSNSGRPFGVNINRDTEIYPEYNPDLGTFGIVVEYRLTDEETVIGQVRTDLDGNVEGIVEIKFKRSIENANADTIHQELFNMLDSNKDGQLDVVEWSGEGGKVLSFASLIVDHDRDKDEKISLAEFQQTRIQPGLRMILDRLDSSQSKDHEE